MAQTLQHDLLTQNMLKAAETVEPTGCYALITDGVGILKKSSGLIPNSQAPLITDANTAPCGWSKTTDTTLNLPASGVGSFLLTLQYDGAAKMQIFFQRGEPSLYVRKRNSSGTDATAWATWRQVSFIA